MSRIVGIKSDGLIKELAATKEKVEAYGTHNGRLLHFRKQIITKLNNIFQEYAGIKNNKKLTADEINNVAYGVLFPSIREEFGVKLRNIGPQSDFSQLQIGEIHLQQGRLVIQFGQRNKELLNVDGPSPILEPLKLVLKDSLKMISDSLGEEYNADAAFTDPTSGNLALSLTIDPSLLSAVKAPLEAIFSDKGLGDKLKDFDAAIRALEEKGEHYNHERYEDAYGHIPDHLVSKVDEASKNAETPLHKG